MYKTQCVLALAALYLGLAHSWDIAVSVRDQLIFFTDDGTKTNTVNLTPHNPAALAYDEVHNMMLYVDKQSEYDAICGYNLNSKENKCFIKRGGNSNIHSIAFDPATDTLFFTDTYERSINSISLKPGSYNNDNGNLLIKMDDGTPTDITVDSCRGYIYWTNTNITSYNYMEGARLNGSDREVIYLSALEVFSMATDLQSPKIFKFYGIPQTTSQRFLSSGSLNDQNAYYIILSDTYLSEPKELTVSKDYLYWMNSSESYTTVWQLPKYTMFGVQPNKISKFYNENPLGIAANYKLKDQIQGLQDCEVLLNLIPKLTVSNNSLNTQQTTETEYITGSELFCVHGTKVSETSVCKCTPGYIGERCDVSVCELYCLQGDCSFNDEGLPKCRCNAGYSGERCEVYACHGYCLNNGICSLNEDDEPFCQCVDNHEGTRCEAAINDAITNTPFDLMKRNLTLADLLSRWRKPASKIFVTVEV